MNRHAARLLPLTAMLLLAAQAAQAETSPWYVGASQAFTHNSNVFYGVDDKALSDTISSTGVRLGLDQPISRQRLSASLSANHNRYSSLDYLNNTDYALDARLDLETVERVSGTVALRAAQSLPTDSNYLTTGQRNLLSTRSLNATGRVGLVTMWTFEAGAAASQTRYSAAAYRGSNADQTSFNAGFRVRPASGLTLGASLRHGKVDYVDVGSEVGRNDLDLLAFVNPGGASSYDARLSLTREAYSYANGLERDRNAWTGSLGWNWKPTGKFSTQLRLSRDTSNASFDYVSNLLRANTDQAQNTTSLRLGANWQATAKIGVDAGLTYARRSLEQGTISGSDRTTGLSLNVSYALMRNVDLGCGLSWANRSVSYATTSQLSTQYKVTTYSCSGQIYLR